MVTLIYFLIPAWSLIAEPPMIDVTTPSGSVIKAELAKTRFEHARGLMGRRDLPARRGMLFIFKKEGIYLFWMKDTLISLDMIWMDSHKRIVHIESDVPPCQSEDCPMYGPAEDILYVLEVNAGMAEKLGIVQGAVLEFELSH